MTAIMLKKSGKRGKLPISALKIAPITAVDLIPCSPSARTVIIGMSADGLCILRYIPV
ncbi:MAG TPA: hypothetical protein VMB35_00400 [Methanomicrobiales archaeon]|nr:hypothetical protein [Methanomicrobiales archaeon]